MGTNLGVLGQMMMQYPKFETFDWAKTQQDALNYRTRLLEFQDLKREQETAARTRQFLQEHPEIVLGQGGGSVLGSLGAAPGGPPRMPGAGPMPALGPHPVTQQQMMPGQPPGAPQMVPGGQDLSQFATQGMTPQSTIASLGSAGQPQGQMQPALGPNPGALQHRFLLDLARSSPDAALKVQQLMQGQQDNALKRDEQRLTMGTKVAEYVGRVAQGVTSPETLEQARQELARIHPQAASQLPQVYSKEAMVPFVKRAVGVADNAKLQLETWKNQIEEQKLGVQLANAGYQGLGTDVTAILRGLTPEQVQQFGGRTSDKAIAYATEEEKKRKLGQAGEAERLKFELEQRQQSTLPLQDARKEDAGLFVYKGTGQGVPGTIPYGQIKTLQDEKDPDKGVVKLANLDEKKQLTTLKQLEPVLQQYKDLAEYAYGTDQTTGKKGPMADYQRGPFQTIGAMWNQLSQDDPVFQAKRRALQGQLQSVVRGLGARGDLNAQELESAQQMLANMDASLGLGLSLGPMVGSGGIGVGGSIKPSISLPDTPETGINIANELIGTVNRRIGSILQHEGYNKTPYIRIRTDQEREAKPGEMPRATAPPKPGPEPVPTPGQPIFPRPQIVIPGEGPAPALPTAPTARPTSQVAPAPAPPSTRPTPPTARSTPAQDEAYRQSVAPQPAPAPAPVPSARPTPGRQSQAPAGTRLAGGPKYMELADVAEAMRQTGRSRAEVEKAARSRGFIVYGSRLPLPEETAIG